MTTNVALFSHLELVDRNLMAALMSQHAGKAGGRRGGVKWDRKYSPHLLHVKHKSVCDLPPEGHINILPAPRQSHSDTISKMQTGSGSHTD